MQHWKLKGNLYIRASIAKIFHILFDFNNLLFNYIYYHIFIISSNSKKKITKSLVHPTFKGLIKYQYNNEATENLFQEKRQFELPRNFYILISSIDFLRVTSHQCLELWRIRRKKIIRDTLVDRFLPPRVFVVSCWPRLFHRVLIELSSRHLSARTVCSCSRMQRGRPFKGDATNPMANTVFESFFSITFLDKPMTGKLWVNWHNWLNENWVTRYFILVFCKYTKYGISRAERISTVVIKI